MKYVFVSALAGLCIGFAAPAGAQMTMRGEGQVRIQSSISFFLPGPVGDGEEAQKVRDQARRTVYEMAARECDLLRETLAKDCRLETVNANINSNRGEFNRQQQQEGYRQRLGKSPDHCQIIEAGESEAIVTDRAARTAWREARGYRAVALDSAEIERDLARALDRLM
jgi:hypothetical protein